VSASATVAESFADYWSAVERGDTAEAVRIAVGRTDEGASLAEVLDGLVCAAQAEVGRRWAANEWNVAQEHRATGVSEEVVAALAARRAVGGEGKPGRVAGSIVVACADGEWHSLPSRVLATTLRGAGWDVTFLGASVPARHLAQLLHDVGPDVVALSCALPTRLMHARQMIEVSRAAGVPVLVGGRGFGPEGKWGLTLGGQRWAPTASAALELLESEDLPSFVSPAPPMQQPDAAAALLQEHHGAIVERAMEAMIRAVRDVAAYDEQQVDRTREDVAHIVDFLAAALYVDDETVFTDFVLWLVELLEARSVPRRTLLAGMSLVGSAMTEVGASTPRAAAMLDAGRRIALSRI
jgi:methanogenic corrinoid protein MtbC1